MSHDVISPDAVVAELRRPGSHAWPTQVVALQVARDPATYNRVRQRRASARPPPVDLTGPDPFWWRVDWMDREYLPVSVVHTLPVSCAGGWIHEHGPEALGLVPLARGVDDGYRIYAACDTEPHAWLIVVDPELHAAMTQTAAERFVLPFPDVCQQMAQVVFDRETDPGSIRRAVADAADLYRPMPEAGDGLVAQDIEDLVGPQAPPLPPCVRQLLEGTALMGTGEPVFTNKCRLLTALTLRAVVYPSDTLARRFDAAKARETPESSGRTDGLRTTLASMFSEVNRGKAYAVPTCGRLAKAGLCVHGAMPRPAECRLAAPADRRAHIPFSPGWRLYPGMDRAPPGDVRPWGTCFSNPDTHEYTITFANPERPPVVARTSASAVGSAIERIQHGTALFDPQEVLRKYRDMNKLCAVLQKQDGAVATLAPQRVAREWRRRGRAAAAEGTRRHAVLEAWFKEGAEPPADTPDRGMLDAIRAYLDSVGCTDFWSEPAYSMPAGPDEADMVSGRPDLIARAGDRWYVFDLKCVKDLPPDGSKARAYAYTCTWYGMAAGLPDDFKIVLLVCNPADESEGRVITPVPLASQVSVVASMMTTRWADVLASIQRARAVDDSAEAWMKERPFERQIDRQLCKLLRGLDAAAPETSRRRAHATLRHAVWKAAGAQTEHEAQTFIDNARAALGRQQ
jgi:hypothetical protein